MNEAPTPIHVLLVDDDSSVLDMTRKYLERESNRFAVETTTDPLEVVDRLDGDLDCIVSDFRMPGMDGLELLEAIRHDRESDVPFIVFTGQGREEVAMQALNLGADRYLQKGGDPASQYGVLARTIEGEVESYRTRARLHEREEYQRITLDSINEGVISTDDGGTITRVNAAVEDLLGLDRSTVVGRGFEEVFDLRDAETGEPIDALVPAVLGEEGTVTYDEPLLLRPAETVGSERNDRPGRTERTGGTVRFVTASAAPIADDTDAVSGVVVTIQNVTGEHRRRHRRERQQEALLELATDDRLAEGEFAAAAGSITETAAETLDVDRVNVWLFDDAGEQIRCVDHYDRRTDTHESGAILHAEDYPEYFEALRTHRTIDAAAAHEDPRTAGLEEDYLRPNDVGALLDATLRSAGETIGVVCHEHVGGPRQWTDDEVQFAGEIADAVHRAWRNREATVQRRELEYRQSLMDAQQEATLDGMLVVDEDRKILSYNERFLELWGIPRALAEDGDDEAILEFAYEALERPEEFLERVTYLYDHPDETSRDEVRLADGRVFDRYTTPVVGDDGTYYGRLWMFRDVTKRRERERAVEELHAIAREFMAAETSERVAEIAVEAARDVLGMPINTVWLHDEGEDVLRPVAWTEQTTTVIGDVPTFSPGESLAWQAFESGEIAVYDDVPNHPDRFNPETNLQSEVVIPLGTHGLLIASATEAGAFDDADVSLAEFLAANADAALTRAEREWELAEAKERHELAIEGGQFGVFDWYNQVGEIRFDERVAEILGFTLEEFGHDLKKWIDHAHPDDLAAVRESQEKVFTGETEYSESEYRMRTKSGDWKWIRSIGTVVEWTDDGEPARTVGVHQDITERKGREEELRRQNERLSEFASIVSHDLRNPLNVAEAWTRKIQKEHDIDRLDKVSAAHARMEALIGDLLTLAREGEAVTETGPVDLAETAHRCWASVDSGRASLVVDTEQVIRADASRLQQLLENLARNAIEHGGEDVTVTVGDLADGFYVEDDGEGIPEGERGHVFDSGYSTGEGTGFGLSIVEQITYGHGWDVRVVEGEAGGARFEFTSVADVDR